jgi:hypothetical protein
MTWEGHQIVICNGASEKNIHYASYARSAVLGAQFVAEDGDRSS